MKLEITNIRIAPNEHSDRWHLYCEYNDAQYHVAVNRRTGELAPDAAKGKIVTLYKNPLATIQEANNPGKLRRPNRYEKGWFNTIKMDANGATGRKIIPAMLKDITALLAEGEKRIAKEAQEAADKAAAGRRAKAISDNAEAMYELVKEFVAAGIPCTATAKAEKLCELIETAAKP